MNKVTHFEVPFDDGDRAKKFYTDVFGWNFQDMPEVDYIMALTTETDETMMPKEAGAINGGMYKRSDKGATSPVLVIDVESVKDHVAKVEAAGGSVVMPTAKIGEMGIYAQVKDSEGNIIGLWQTVTQ